MKAYVEKVYLTRALMPLPIQVGVFFTAREFHAELKRLDIPKCDFMQSIGSPACVHSFFNDKTGAELNFICIDMKQMKGKTAAEVVGIVAHECVHVMQHCMEFIGEKTPSKEFMAYSVQHLVQNVMERLEAYK